MNPVRKENPMARPPSPSARETRGTSRATAAVDVASPPAPEPVAAPVAAPAAPAVAATPGELSATLLEVLRSLNQQVQQEEDKPVLSDAALIVALNYRQIAIDLLTLADLPPTPAPPYPSPPPPAQAATRAPGPSA
jgi:hypothetical protein